MIFLFPAAMTISTSDKATEFLFEYGILKAEKKCDSCGEILVQSDIHNKPSNNYEYFKCKNCKTSASIRNGTILSCKNISFQSWILLAYKFVM